MGPTKIRWTEFGETTIDEVHNGENARQHGWGTLGLDLCDQRGTLKTERKNYPEAGCCQKEKLNPMKYKNKIKI